MNAKTSSNFPIWLLLLIGANSILFLFPIASCLNHRGAKQSEGGSYVVSLNRGQQDYFKEKGRFASSVDALGANKPDGIGKIPTDTSNYSYSIYVDSSRKTTAKIDYPQIAIQVGQSKIPMLPSYIGAVWLRQIATSSYFTSETIVCMAEEPGTSVPPVPIIKSEGIMECAPGTQFVEY